MEQVIVTVEETVFDRRTGDLRWAVVAAFTAGERGDPVCVEYRIRAVRGTSAPELVRHAHQTLNAMGRHATESLAGAGAFPDTGIPRYVFDAASQGRLIEKARARLKRNPAEHKRLSREARALLAPPASGKPGRPPKRSMAEKLKILAAVEAAQDSGETLEDVATRFYMSRSAVRDLLSWARGSQPRMFTASGQGRRGGQMTAEARAMLRDIEGGES